jgi:membrane protease YdiL (CAAX protease family)
MLANFSAKAAYATGLCLWVVAVFLIVQVITQLFFIGLSSFIPAIATLNEAILATLSAVVVYAISIVIIVTIPYIIKKKKVTLHTLGLDRLLSWSDMGVGILAILPYLMLSAGLMFVVGQLWSGFNPSQEQLIPFSNLQQRYEVIVAFITLVVLAPVAEETLFRGYLLGKIMEKVNKWAAVIVTAIVFGLLHLPGAITENGVDLQWAVAIDTLSLGFILGLLRLFTGSIWAGILLHMIKNSVAFYFLFIYPTMPGTL